MKINPLQESAAKPLPDGGVEWVYMTDVGQALKTGCKATVRTSELSIFDTKVCMKVHLTNVAAESGITVHSVLEPFDVPMTRTDNALPLASVHAAPAGSILLHAPLDSFYPHTQQGETLVPRIAERDVALLAGRWDGYGKLVASVQGIPDGAAHSEKELCWDD